LWVGFSVVGTLLLIWLASVARAGGPTWPVADFALLEIYTMHAERGQQLLGAYSQYGWYHPGPLLFYLLAPFYIIGGRTRYGLELGALAINLGSLLTIATILGRRRDVTPFTAMLLFAGLFFYVLRLPDLLTNAWNPIVAVLPLAALLICTAATVTGDVSVVLLIVVLASLVTQTHVGYAPIALVLGGTAIAALAWHAARGQSQRQWLALALLSLVLVQLVWLPAFAEQLTGHPGNLTKLWRFFVQGAETQTLDTSGRAWSAMLMGLVRPDLALPMGWGFGASSPTLLVVLAVLSTAALPVIVIARWRDGHGFESALAGVCLTATVVGFWSVVHIQGPILDNQLFWLSVLGVFDLSLAAALLMSAAGRWLRGGGWNDKLRSMAAAVLLLGSVAIGPSVVRGNHLDAVAGRKRKRPPSHAAISRELPVDGRQETAVPD